MTRRRMLLRYALAWTVLVACVPAAAGAAWAPPQRLSQADFYYGTALASNARGDTVLVYGHGSGMRLARAAPGGRFGRAVAISGSIGQSPRVAIDARGVALISWAYESDSFEIPDLRGTAMCCTGTKVVVWRPGHAPTRPRTVRRPGITTVDAALAAVRGRRGVVVNSYDRDGKLQPVRYVPIALDGRLGKARLVASRGWHAASLQLVAGRAVVGLVSNKGPTRLAVRTQRRTGSFGGVRTFLRVPEELSAVADPRQSDLLMTADGRGGHVAVLRRGAAPRMTFEVVRKPRGKRLRRVAVDRGATSHLVFSRPSVAADGWIAVAVQREFNPFAFIGTGYVVTIRPDGRARVTRLTGEGDISSPAATVRAGGSGAAGFNELLVRGNTARERATWLALAGGRPRPAETLTATQPFGSVDDVAMSSSRRERARVVWSQADRLFASRLE